jgi:hypothetical protein
MVVLIVSSLKSRDEDEDEGNVWRRTTRRSADKQGNAV